VVDLGRLGRALQPPRRRHARAAAADPGRPRAGRRRRGGDRPRRHRRQHRLRAQPRCDADGPGRRDRGRPAGARMWAIGIGLESGAMLAEDRDAVRRVRRDHDLKALLPADLAEALDPHHFAECFGLFLIILLGEVVAEAGQGSVAAARDVPARPAAARAEPVRLPVAAHRLGPDVRGGDDQVLRPRRGAETWRATSAARAGAEAGRTSTAPLRAHLLPSRS